MPVHLIDHEWAEQQFPSIFRFFRASRLRAQVEAFDEIVEEQEYSWNDIDVVFTHLVAEVKEAHAPLLFAMSSAHGNNPSPWHVGTIRFMEGCLTRALQAGVTEGVYRSMLVSTGSYLDLLGELDWADQLRQTGGEFSAHSPTDPAGEDSNRNYDLHWVQDGRTLRGDAKCFKDWLVKTRDGNLLSGHIKLLAPDLHHDITVKAPVRNRTINQVIDAAQSSLELYHAAVNNTADQRWVISNVPGGRIVQLRAAFYQEEGALPVPVESVRVRLDHHKEAGHVAVTIVESNFTDLEDRAAARKNLLDGASQVSSPAPGGNELSCIMLGSAAAADSSDVEAALLVIWDGSPIHRRKEVTAYVATTRGKIVLEALPGYAPDLNPWDEGGWHHLKHVQLRNVVCRDLEELHEEFHLALHRLRQRPHMIRSFFAQAGLTIRKT